MHKTGPVLWITAAILLALALAVGIGGIWLIALGGSWYYAAAAVALLATGILLLRRSPLALWVYAAFTLGTLAWALYEVGFDWWALAPRGDLVILLGVWLALPFVRRRLVPTFGDHPPSAFRGGGLALVIAIVASAGVAAYAMTGDEHQVRGSLAANAGNGAESDVPAIPPGEWHAYGRTDFGQRYSPLSEITPANVGNLEVAWHYHTGDVKQPGDTKETTYQVTPLKIGSRLYLCTPHNIAIALDAASGEEVWRYDPGIEPSKSRQHQTCRGVSYFDGDTARGTRVSVTAAEAEADAPEAPTAQQGGTTGASVAETAEPAQAASDTAAAVNAECPRRIYLPTADARLIALNADTGEVCASFAENGWIDLSENMPHWEAGFYYSTSPPVIANGIIVVGGAVNDNVSTTETSGVIRGYDADTGEIMWAFDSGNPDQTAPLPPGETYTENSPNAWSILSADEQLGLVYAPLGNAPPDQFGGNRSENVERFSSSVVALDLQTGALRWVFQTVHHDLWDYDVPSQPTLADLTIDGETVPALVQPTKQGEIYVLNRETGEPILPVEEVPVPQGAAEGDFTAPTQPVSALSFGPPPLEGSDMWGATMVDQMVCRVLFQQLRYEGRYTPPSTQGTLVHPGNFGVFNWGSVAVDPVRQALFATPSYLAFVSTLIPREDPETNYVSEGKPGINENYGAPYAVDLAPFTSPVTGLPCQAPPWGYVAGADLTTGETVWMHRNGTVRDRFVVPLPLKMGVPDLGGPLMTAGGVAFMSGTIDYYVRAYDVSDGEQLWESRLPAGGQATPMTYEEGGRQYLLVVAGGHGSLETETGDSVIAYALPES